MALRAPLRTVGFEIGPDRGGMGKGPRRFPDRFRTHSGPVPSGFRAICGAFADSLRAQFRRPTLFLA
jgi:hypothetical protein